MIFSSTYFLFLFLPIVLFVYYVPLKKFRNAQNVFLLISSLLFYAFGEPKFVFIMILSILINYIFGILVDRFRKDKLKSKLILSLMIFSNLLILFIFKYLMFSLEIINSVFNTNINIPSIALPIGISFFTFQAISYVIDVYREKGAVQKNPLNVGLYISFFPQLIAGPIVRYETVAYEIENRKETLDDFTSGITHFMIGLSKKVLLSNTLAILADYSFNIFSNPNDIYNTPSVLMAWTGAIAYTLQIYFDFSGYSDMAIGLGKMFGFHFNENFNYPYISRSVSEFWRRWHISLGTWFKDYVYFPLGGSKVSSTKRLFFNIFIVWFLTGLWHGANWTFICWGLLYFILISIEKILKLGKNTNPFGIIYTLTFVILGWVLFRAPNLSSAIYQIKAMFGFGVNTLYDETTLFYIKDNIVFILFGIICSSPIIPFVKSKLKDTNFILEILSAIIIVLLFIISISYLIKGTYNPFIYFNF